MASRDQYKDWVVRALTAIGTARPQAVYEWVRRNEPVPAADLHGVTSDGESLFEKNLRWARFDLHREGVVLSPARGQWALANR